MRIKASPASGEAGQQNNKKPINMSENRKLIKIATAGSVDDGKSTLIGRLLYDTKSLTTDKIEAIERSSKQRGYDYLDFSLATDGLVAEREQGITIDVAHIYFNTAKTNFIVADTPGHVEYTRNMVTGASTSQVAIILIDARKGVTFSLPTYYASAMWSSRLIRWIWLIMTRKCI